MDRTGWVSVCIATDRHNKSIITITNRQSIKPVCCSASHRQRYGDRLVGLCQGVRVNTYLSLVLRVRASGAVSALECTGRPLPYTSCQNSTSVDVSSPVIAICGGVQFVMDRNTER